HYFYLIRSYIFFFFFQAEDGIRDGHVTGVQTCALPIYPTMITFIVGLIERIRLSTSMPFSPGIRRSSNTRSGRDRITSFKPSSRSEERRVGKECRFGWSPNH